MTSVYFQTHGCSTNMSESEVMQGLLAKAGFRIADRKEPADIIVINICTVKGEATALKEIRKLKEEFSGKKLIVAGCITPELIPKIRETAEDASLLSTHNIRKIVEIAEEVVHDNIVDLVAEDEQELKLCLPKIRKNPIIGIVPILSGCNFSCSYCSVKLIKGRLISYPREDILKEVNQCLKDGCKEIWITSQDNAAYMLENREKSELPSLLREITELTQDFKLRIGMMNPSNLMPVIDEMIEIYKCSKLFKFLHVPVQSGNNDILKLMSRHYSVDDFRNIIREFRAKIQDITISTDIIAGFPTETEEQFNDSLDLIRELKPDVLNISRYIPRPGTKAAALEQLDGGIVKNRSRLLTDIFNNIARMQNERWLNWTGPILIDEAGKDDSWIGRNLSYKPVVVKGSLKLGQEVDVKITNATSFDLRGDVIK